MTGDEQARSFGGFFQFVKYQHMCTLIEMFFWDKPADHLKPADEKVNLPQVRQENLDSEAHPNDLTR